MNSPLIIPRSDHNLSRNHITPEALKVLYRLKECGFLGYIAGGGVRDLLLGRRPKDFDVVTDATPNELRRMFRNCRLIGRRFRLVHVFFRDHIVEVATFRADSTSDVRAVGESSAAPQDAHSGDRSHKPQRGGHATTVKRHDGLILRDNVFGTPEQDAKRRDFTVNALFYNIADFSIIDYVGGMADLKHKIIRSIGDPCVRYTEDPIRMIRAVRFASALGLHIEEKTDKAITRCRHSLTKASNARLYEEILKLFFCGAAEKAYTHLARTGLWTVMFPQLTSWIHHSDTAARAAAVRRAFSEIDRRILARAPVEPAMLFALVFGDCHESRAEQLMRQGMGRNLAIAAVTSQHLSELSDRIFIPKKVGDQLTRILVSHDRPDHSHPHAHPQDARDEPQFRSRRRRRRGPRPRTQGQGQGVQGARSRTTTGAKPADRPESHRADG